MDRIRKWMERQSRRRARSCGAEQVLRVLPRHRSAERRGADRRAGRAAHARPLDRGRPQAARLRHAVLHRGRAADRERSRDTKFRRLMIAQDTGGAIVGPARADIYFGAGDEAGRIAGRIRHDGRFVMLVPHELDPAPRTKCRCRGRGRRSTADRGRRKTAGQGEAKPTPAKPRQDAASRPTAAKPGTKPAKTAGRRPAPAKKPPTTKVRQKPEARSKSDAAAEPSRIKPSRHDPRHEQAAAERRRARAVERRHPLDRAAAEDRRSASPRTLRRSAAPAAAKAARQACAACARPSPRNAEARAPPPLAPLDPQDEAAHRARRAGDRRPDRPAWHDAGRGA